MNFQAPERVRLDCRIAGLGARFVAAFLDGIALGALLALLGLFYLALTPVLFAGEKFMPFSAAGKFALAFLSVAGFALFWGYNVYYEIRPRAATPGKMAAGIRVIKEDGGPIRPVDSWIRNLFRAIDFLPGGYFIGAVALLFTQKNQRLGDLAAGSVVVYAEREKPLASDARRLRWLYPPLAEFHDAGPLSAGEYELIVDFLSRRAALSLEKRAELSRKIGEPLVGKYRLNASRAENYEHVLECLVRPWGQ